MPGATAPAVDVVERQLAAYNDRDLARFLVNYSDAIVVYRMPSSAPSLSGKAAFAEFYATQRFSRPQLRAEILNRMAFGNKVVDHERIFGIGATPVEAVAVYEVVAELIARVWFFAPE